MITVIGDLGSGSALIRRLDGSFWIVDYAGQCSSLTYSSSDVEVEGFGSPDAELVVRRAFSDDERCPIVGEDGRIERATVSPVGGFGSAQAILTRGSDEEWEIEYGSGCTSLAVGEVVTGYIRSPGEFAGEGSEIIVVDPYDQSCRIQSSLRLGVVGTPTAVPVSTPAPSSIQPMIETVTVVGDLGGGSALIRRLDGSFWIVDYVGQCSSLTYSSSVVEVKGFGTLDAELVVRRAFSDDERCRIVDADGRIERATVSPVGGFGSAQAILTRGSDEEWEIEYGSGCTSLAVGEVVTGYIRSPGEFAGEGSEIIVVDPYDQRCRILSADGP